MLLKLVLFFFFDSSENQTNKTIDASVNKKAADSTSQVRFLLFQSKILITVHRIMDFHQYSLQLKLLQFSNHTFQTWNFYLCFSVSTFEIPCTFINTIFSFISLNVFLKAVLKSLLNSASGSTWESFSLDCVLFLVGFYFTGLLHVCLIIFDKFKI